MLAGQPGKEGMDPGKEMVRDYMRNTPHLYHPTRDIQPGISNNGYQTRIIQQGISNHGFSVKDNKAKISIQPGIYNQGYQTRVIQQGISNQGYPTRDIKPWIFSKGQYSKDIHPRISNQ